MAYKVLSEIYTTGVSGSAYVGCTCRMLNNNNINPPTTAYNIQNSNVEIKYSMNNASNICTLTSPSGIDGRLEAQGYSGHLGTISSDKVTLLKETSSKRIYTLSNVLIFRDIRINDTNWPSASSHMFKDYIENTYYPPATVTFQINGELNDIAPHMLIWDLYSSSTQHDFLTINLKSNNNQTHDWYYYGNLATQNAGLIDTTYYYCYLYVTDQNNMSSYKGAFNQYMFVNAAGSYYFSFLKVDNSGSSAGNTNGIFIMKNNGSGIPLAIAKDGHGGRSFANALAAMLDNTTSNYYGVFVNGKNLSQSCVNTKTGAPNPISVAPTIKDSIQFIEKLGSNYVLANPYFGISHIEFVFHPIHYIQTANYSTLWQSAPAVFILQDQNIFNSAYTYVNGVQIPHTSYNYYRPEDIQMVDCTISKYPDKVYQKYENISYPYHPHEVQTTG